MGRKNVSIYVKVDSVIINPPKNTRESANMSATVSSASLRSQHVAAVSKTKNVIASTSNRTDDYIEVLSDDHEVGDVIEVTEQMLMARHPLSSSEGIFPAGRRKIHEPNQRVPDVSERLHSELKALRRQVLLIASSNVELLSFCQFFLSSLKETGFLVEMFSTICLSFD